MSKKVKSFDPSVSWGYGYVVNSAAPDEINGRLFQIIEAMGLPERQEESIKGLIRKETWAVFADAVHISPERHNKLREEHYLAIGKARQENLPVSAI